MNVETVEIYVDPTISGKLNYFIFTERTEESSKKFIKGAFKLVPVSGEEADWVLSQKSKFEALSDVDALLDVVNGPFQHDKTEGKFLLGKNILSHIDFSKA